LSEFDLSLVKESIKRLERNGRPLVDEFRENEKLFIRYNALKDVNGHFCFASLKWEFLIVDLSG
jgi:hypothetical protein